MKEKRDYLCWRSWGSEEEMLPVVVGHACNFLNTCCPLSLEYPSLPLICQSPYRHYKSQDTCALLHEAIPHIPKYNWYNHMTFSIQFYFNCPLYNFYLFRWPSPSQDYEFKSKLVVLKCFCLRSHVSGQKKTLIAYHTSGSQCKTILTISLQGNFTNISFTKKNGRSYSSYKTLSTV